MPTTFSKGFLELQVLFAERIKAMTGLALEQALFEYTNGARS